MMVNAESYVRNTSGGEIPDASKWGEWLRRLKADSVIFGMKRNWMIGIGAGFVAGISALGYRLWKRRKEV